MSARRRRENFWGPDPAGGEGRGELPGRPKFRRKSENIFENTIAINFNHRWIGSFTFIYILSFTIYLLLSSKITITIKPISLFAVLFFSSLQFFLGILTLLSNVKISFASLHQSNSVLLLASLLFAYYQFKNNANKPNSL